MKFDFFFEYSENSNFILFIYVLRILTFVATVIAKNNYHGTNQKRENRFL
jgi:hypothetical protein